VNNVFERAVFRHPGSVELWREYLQYLTKSKATRKWKRVMTKALQMHPMSSELWVMAGRKPAQDGDMDTAREIFLRGGRFCVREPSLWIEYARCEMECLAKMERKSKPSEHERKQLTEPADDEVDEYSLGEEDDDDMEAGALIQPEIFAIARQAQMAGKDGVQKSALENTVMDGAIPLAIFRATKTQKFFNAGVAEAFFDLFSSFTTVSVHDGLSQKVLDDMTEMYPRDPSTCNCYTRQPIQGLDPLTVEFPRALRETLPRLKKSMETTTNRPELARKTVAWMDPILDLEGLDEGIRAVLESTKRKIEL
jgi:U3 small nucleolar RNA-associated protein 6